MKKPKIIKKLPKSKSKSNKSAKFQTKPKQENKFADNYLQFYDDIKLPSKRHDW